MTGWVALYRRGSAVRPWIHHCFLNDRSSLPPVRSHRLPCHSFGLLHSEWSPAELPMLGVASMGAAKLALATAGMSLPSYSDSAKVAYVLQDRC